MSTSFDFDSDDFNDDFDIGTGGSAGIDQDLILRMLQDPAKFWAQFGLRLAGRQTSTAAVKARASILVRKRLTSRARAVQDYKFE